MVAVIEVPCTSSLSTKAINVWHFQIPESNVLTEVSACQDALDAFYEAVKLYLAPQTITIGAEVKTVDKSPNIVVPGASEQTVATGTGFSNLAGAAVVTHRAAQIGGRYRGRKFIGPLDPAAVATNGRELTTTARNVFITAIGALITFSTAGVEFGTWSRAYNSFSISTVGSCNTTLGIQRGRLT